MGSLVVRSTASKEEQLQPSLDMLQQQEQSEGATLQIRIAREHSLNTKPKPPSVTSIEGVISQYRADSLLVVVDETTTRRAIPRIDLPLLETRLSSRPISKSGTSRRSTVSVRYL